MKLFSKKQKTDNAQAEKYQQLIRESKELLNSLLNDIEMKGDKKQ